MKRTFSKGIMIGLLLAGALSLCFVLGLVIGPIFQGDSDSQSAATELSQNTLPDLLLRAEAAASGKQVGLATGRVDNDNDALFALDYSTGDLYCWVVHPRVGPGFQAEYGVNVEEALGVKKGEPADYTIITGLIDSTGLGTTNNSRPANTVCYVADGNTGRVAGFSFVYSRARAQYGRMQAGELKKVCEGRTRGNIERE